MRSDLQRTAHPRHAQPPALRHRHLSPLHHMSHVAAASNSAPQATPLCPLQFTQGNSIPALFPPAPASSSLPLLLSLTRHKSPLRPRSIPTASSLSEGSPVAAAAGMIHVQPSCITHHTHSGALLLASFLQIQPPQPPLPPLVSRFAYYLQLPDICVATALSIRLLLPSFPSSPLTAASLLLLAAALLYHSPDAAPVIPVAHVSNRGDITPTPSPPRMAASSSPRPIPLLSLRQMVHAAAM